MSKQVVSEVLQQEFSDSYAIHIKSILTTFNPMANTNPRAAVQRLLQECPNTGIQPAINAVQDSHKTDERLRVMTENLFSQVHPTALSVDVSSKRHNHNNNITRYTFYITSFKALAPMRSKQQEFEKLSEAVRESFTSGL